MFAYKLVMLGYIFVVEIGNTQIEKDVEYKSKIEYCKIQAKLFGAYGILHIDVDTQNPKGFYKYVEQQKQQYARKKFFTHGY